MRGNFIGNKDVFGPETARREPENAKMFPAIFHRARKGRSIPGAKAMQPRAASGRNCAGWRGKKLRMWRDGQNNAVTKAARGCRSPKARALPWRARERGSLLPLFEHRHFRTCLPNFCPAARSPKEKPKGEEWFFQPVPYQWFFCGLICCKTEGLSAEGAVSYHPKPLTWNWDKQDTQALKEKAEGVVEVCHFLIPDMADNGK
jgi:hypothetical protein